MSSYTNIFYQPGDSPVFCYRSGKLVYEESFVRGALASGGYNTAGFPLNVLSNVPTRIFYRALREPSSFNIEVNGRNVDRCWHFAGFEDIPNENGHTGIITLENTAFALTAKIYTVLDGTQMLSRYYEITNNSRESLSLSRISLLSGAVETIGCKSHLTTSVRKAGELYEIGYFDNDGAIREGEFNWHPLHADKQSFSAKFERDRFRHPAVFVRNKITGTMFFAQAAWTGGCTFAFDLNALEERESALLSLNIGLSGYNPLYVLKPGETFTSPEVIFGMITGGLDDAVNEMNAHIRKSVLNMPEADGSALTVGAGMGAEHDMSVETTKAFMRQMKEMGAELFIIDAGWQCAPHCEMQWYVNNGNNTPNAERYPNGIKELKDYAASIGMKLGMWMEPERLGGACEVYAKHPDWIASNYWGDKNEGFIDLTNPEAFEWVENEIAKFIESNEIDLLRIDHNGGPDYFCVRDGECLNIRLTEAVYRLYRNLKKRFPNVAFENCASGGGRTDLGMMKAFNHTWVSDWQRLPRSVLITNGMTLVLPPERVDRLFAGMNSHEIGSLALNMRNTMLGHMSLNVISPAAAEINTEAMDFVRHSVSVYKDFIRGFIPTCRIYHHTPEVYRSLESGYSATELVSEDKTKAVIHVCTLTNPQQRNYTVLPRGLDRSKTYKVTLDNTGESFEVSGFALMNDGLRLRIPSALMSELVLFEEKR